MLFDRFTEESRRAIYFAREVALSAAARAIDSEHILLGLLIEKNSRANTLFSLRQLLPEQFAQLINVKLHPVGGRELPLAIDGKRVVAFATEEANGQRDYWIDTDHLILGILREEESPACKALNQAGVRIETARQTVADNKRSRPDLGHLPVLWWAVRRPFRRFIVLAGLLGLFLGWYLIEVLTKR
jgi:ATP-dependent Clp protease ATP-binding subunit ClpC